MSDPQTNKPILPITQRVVGLCYALFTFACYLPLWPLFLVGLAIKLYWQNRAQGTWLATHFEYQKDSLLVAFAVFATVMALDSGFLGAVVLPEVLKIYLPTASRAVTVLMAVWLAFRMIKGWVRLHAYQAMAETPRAAPAAVMGEAAPVPAEGVRSATRSMSATMLPIMVVANILTLAWVFNGFASIADPSAAVMGLIYFVIWLGWATVGTLLYGSFLVSYWISLPASPQNGRKSAWLLTAACLVMVLINTFPLLPIL